MSKMIEIKGTFPDQQGKVIIGRIIGCNGLGISCRKYTWVEPVLPWLKGKTFEAFDDQIKNAIKRAK